MISANEQTVYLTVHGKKHEICGDDSMNLVKHWMRGYEARCD